MGEVLAHRGPDGHGLFVDGPCGLIHRRLAILDLSPQGAQPMGSADGRFTITFNGEIYNYQELRLACEERGVRFKSSSDTEVLLEAFALWGREIVDRLNGMFAFAIWDRKKQELFLARDRYGIKPLYYTQTPTFFSFASEIKALLELPDFHKKINYDALGQYVSFQNIFDEQTFFDGVYLLEPGYTALVTARGEFRKARYWDFQDWWREDITDIAEAREEVSQALQRAVSRQLQSDVPVGSFLSGGLDSGALVALASRQLGRISTFTCGYDLSSASGLEINFDERQQAEALANIFKTEHYEVVLHAGDMEYVMRDLTYHMDEPRLGQSYPNYYASRLASKFVKVALSGAGGDELFGGYPWRYMRGLSKGRGIADLMDESFGFWQRVVSSDERSALFADRVASSLASFHVRDRFSEVMRSWRRDVTSDADAISLSLYFELKTFLRGILVVEDKLSMAHGLETRVPFLDDDVVRVALRIAPSLKLQGPSASSVIDENTAGKKLLFSEQTAEGKFVLRQALSGIVPQEVTQRAKQGFSAPDASWFRGESIAYINQLLRNDKARIYEIFNRQPVEDILDQHCSGQRNRRLAIWSLLSLEHWMRIFFSG
jgi:asparagine synthase (glutamine-hydrolysing)